MVAQKEIHVGEELSFSYLPKSATGNYFQHQILAFDYLKRVYFFSCTCKNCHGMSEL